MFNFVIAVAIVSMKMYLCTKQIKAAFKILTDAGISKRVNIYLSFVYFLTFENVYSIYPIQQEANTYENNMKNSTKWRNIIIIIYETWSLILL